MHALHSNCLAIHFLVVGATVYNPITVILVHADLGLNIYNEHNSLTYVSCIILFLKKQADTEGFGVCMNLPTAVRSLAMGSYKKYKDGNPIGI